MATKPSELLTSFETAVRVEQDARRRLREAMLTEGEILRQLRASGVSTSFIAIRFARAVGLPPGMATRRRAAAIIRQRTRRHTFLPRPAGAPEPGLLDSQDSQRKETEAMPRLIKRIVTEEFIQTVEEAVEKDSSKLDEESDESDETDEDEADDDDTEGGRATRRSSPTARRNR